jgi:hypothetical protein
LTDETQPSGQLAGPITLALLILVGFLSLLGAEPPAAVDENAPATEFSAVRAMRDVRAITQKPHPLGSAENDRVRDYLAGRLRELGASPEVLTATVARNTPFGPDKWAVVNNLVAKIPGTDPAGGAVLMVAHYDSVPSGPGAGDNAASVAAILETMRALKAGPALRNDLIILFTDGEELGRLGAAGFVEKYPALGNIKVVLNFAMGGDEGASMMYQPSTQDWWLIDRLAAAGPYPRRTSIAPLLSPGAPRETDLDIFLDAGIDGMTFGALRGITRYHTELDNADLLDQRSLQQQGMRALSMAQQFGAIDLNDLPAAGAASLVRDRPWLAIPLAVVVPILALGLIWIGIREGQFSIRGTAAGFVVYAVALVISVIEARFVWYLTTALAGWRMLPVGATYGGFYDSIGAIALVFGTLWAAYELISSISLPDLSAGALVAWTVLAIGMSIAKPGGSHPFLWPLLLATLALIFGADTTAARMPIRRAILALIALVPAIVALAPSFAASTSGTMLLFVYAGLASGLLFGWFIPYIGFLTGGRRLIVPGALGALALAMFVSGSVASRFDASRPHPDSIFYFLDADVGRARWISLDSRPDYYTAQFFQHHVRGGWMSRLSGLTTSDTPAGTVAGIARYRDFAFLNRGRTTEGDAPLIDAPAPELKVLDDSTTAGGTRTVKMHIASARGASIMWMTVPVGITVLRSSIDGKMPGDSVSSGWTGWYWHIPPAGFDLELRLTTPAPFVVTLVDQSAGLPETPDFAIKPRPADTMPTPFLFFDSTTLVRKTYSIGGEQMTRR